METILAFMIDNSQYIIGAIGGLGIGIFVMQMKKGGNENDMTNRVIKLKRYTNSVNMRTKTFL